MTTVTRIAAALASVLLFLGAAPSRASAPTEKPQRFAVIVHPSNKVRFEKEEQARQAVRKLFLRSSGDWKGGLEAKPYFPKENEPAYRVLLERVIGMSSAELARHWISMKNTQGIAPPKAVSGAAKMRKYVSHFDGGLGIVPFDEGLESDKDKVRVLFVIESAEE